MTTPNTSLQWAEEIELLIQKNGGGVRFAVDIGFSKKLIKLVDNIQAQAYAKGREDHLRKSIDLWYGELKTLIAKS